MPEAGLMSASACGTHFLFLPQACLILSVHTHSTEFTHPLVPGSPKCKPGDFKGKEDAQVDGEKAFTLLGAEPSPSELHSSLHVQSAIGHWADSV